MRYACIFVAQGDPNRMLYVRDATSLDTESLCQLRNAIVLDRYERWKAIGLHDETASAKTRDEKWTFVQVAIVYP